MPVFGPCEYHRPPLRTLYSFKPFSNLFGHLRIRFLQKLYFLILYFSNTYLGTSQPVKLDQNKPCCTVSICTKLCQLEPICSNLCQPVLLYQPVQYKCRYSCQGMVWYVSHPLIYISNSYSYRFYQVKADELVLVIES